MAGRKKSTLTSVFRKAQTMLGQGRTMQEVLTAFSAHGLTEQQMLDGIEAWRAHRRQEGSRRRVRSDGKSPAQLGLLARTAQSASVPEEVLVDRECRYSLGEPNTLVGRLVGDPEPGRLALMQRVCAQISPARRRADQDRQIIAAIKAAQRFA